MHSHSKSLIVLNFAAICYSQKQACCIKISIFSVWKTVIYYMWRSSSMRGCGLKCWGLHVVTTYRLVILHARMWIEMVSPAARAASSRRHPPCEDVDWNYNQVLPHAACHESSSVRGCGLKYFVVDWPRHRLPVILYARMWIEILDFFQGVHNS